MEKELPEEMTMSYSRYESLMQKIAENQKLSAMISDYKKTVWFKLYRLFK